MASLLDDPQVDAPKASTDYGYDYSGPDFEIGALLRSLVSVIQRNLFVIFAILLLFVLAAAIITMLQVPKYTANATIEIQNQSEDILGEGLDSSSQQVDSWDTERFLNTQMRILKSRTLAERVAEANNLYSDPRFLTAMRVEADSFASERDRRESVISHLMDNFSAALPVETRIIQIEFESTDPQISSQILNAFANEFIELNLKRKFDSSSYAREFVQDQLSEARQRLEESEQKLNTYARSASLIRTRDPSNNDGNTSSSVTSSSLMQVNEEANAAQSRLVATQARWQAEQAQPLLSSPAALSSAVVQQLLKERAEIQSQLSSARSRYLPDHPTVTKLESDLRNVEQQLNRAATEARNAVRVDYNAALQSQQKLQQQVEALKGATLQEQDRSVRYNTLAREADTNREIYDGLLQRYRELNASAGITASNISVIDPADVPAVPSSPKLLLNFAIGLFLGLLTAALTVFLREHLDDRIRVPEEVEQKVSLNLLGVIPQAEDASLEEELRDPKSMVSESYSALRSSLLYSTRDGLPRLILVTSAQPSEGKSTTSFSIARSMALIGKRTLLIDADLRRPSLHRLAEINNSVGLSSVLVGECEASEAVVPGEIEGLAILPSGPIPPSPAELLSSPRLMALLSKMRDQYDLVVIDSAPVLGLADSPALSALADGVLLIVEANRARGGQLKAAVRRLRMMKPTILGVVLTKFDARKAGNAYSTYYQYNYYNYGESRLEVA